MRIDSQEASVTDPKQPSSDSCVSCLQDPRVMFHTQWDKLPCPVLFSSSVMQGTCSLLPETMSVLEHPGDDTVSG